MKKYYGFTYEAFLPITQKEWDEAYEEANFLDLFICLLVDSKTLNWQMGGGNWRGDGAYVSEYFIPPKRMTQGQAYEIADKARKRLDALLQYCWWASRDPENDPPFRFFSVMNPTESYWYLRSPLSKPREIMWNIQEKLAKRWGYE